MVKKIILDMDPGIDDALALVAACRWDKAQILGVSTVAGNLPLDTVTANASGILRVMQSSAQVYPGASMPLHGKLQDASDIHGAKGLGHWQVEPDSSRVSHGHAAQFIAETVRANPGQVTLVATGPLTNIALALDNHPEDMEKLAGLVFMGGALTVPGNVTPVAEYNIYADPAAAEIVLNSPLKPIMVGLDVTRQVCLKPEDVDRLARAGEVAQAVAAMASYYMENFAELPLHDPLALLAAVEPNLFQLDAAAVRVEARGELTRGQTIMDLDGSRNWPKNIAAALAVDARRCKEVLMDLWTRC